MEGRNLVLTRDIRTLIYNHSAGMDATVNADGTPSVSFRLSVGIF